MLCTPRPSTSVRIRPISTIQPDTKLSVPQRITSPLASALNTLDGFSTTAVISVPFNAPVDPATLVPFNPLTVPTGNESIFVLDATQGVPLVPGVDYCRATVERRGQRRRDRWRSSR